MSKALIFERRLANGSAFRLGTAVEYSGGWRFFPNVSGRKPSRRFHVTMESCLPAWLNYPNGCESRTGPEMVS